MTLAGIDAAAIAMHPLEGGGIRLAIAFSSPPGVDPVDETIGAGATQHSHGCVVRTVDCPRRSLLPQRMQSATSIVAGRPMFFADRADAETRFRRFSGGEFVDPFRDASDFGVLAHLVSPWESDHRLLTWFGRVDRDHDESAASEAVGLFAVLGELRRLLVAECRDDLEHLQEQLAELGRPERHLIHDLTSTLVATSAVASSAPAPPRAVDDREPVGEAELRTFFAVGGGLEREVEGYVPRAAQSELAVGVADAIRRGKALTVEAGTGVGKTFGYLVPLLLHAVRSPAPVVVATQTKNLQAQLYEKDLPVVARALGLAVKATVVKGRGDYLCRQRLATRLALVRDEAEEIGLSALLFERFERRSPDGDLERISPWWWNRFPSGRSILEEVRCEHGAVGKLCRYGDDCFYPTIAKRAAASHLLIANHALALRWPRAFPAPSALLFDEAHGLLDVATDAFALRGSESGLRYVVSLIRGRRRGGGIAALVARSERREGNLSAAVHRRVADLIDDGDRLLHHLDQLVIAVSSLRARGGLADSPEGVRPLLRIDVRLRGSAEFESIRGSALGVVERGARMLARMGRLRRDLILADRSDDEERRRELKVELGAIAGGVEGGVTSLEALLRGGEGSVCWIEWGMTSRRSFAWTVAPVDVGEEFVSRIVESHPCTILTSATLRVGDDFSFFLSRLGLDRVDEGRRVPPLALGSPFRYADLLRFYVPLGRGFDPTSATDDESARWSARGVLIVAETLGGRTLGLFNSRTRLAKAAALLRGPLRDRGIDLFAVGEDGSPARVLEQFRRSQNGVLLGARAFYEGIDVAGGRLVCAIIERLPFESPDVPMHAARVEDIESRGGSGFESYTLPRAIVRLRQGAGRLIRGEGDRGAVFLLDPRVATSRFYGEKIRRALPAECRIGPDRAIFTEWRARFADQIDPDAPPLEEVILRAESDLGIVVN